VITHSARCFRDEAAVPVIGVQSVPDFNFPRLFSVMIKTAVTDNRFFATRHHGKL
jgi:hypothetical protein